jgi:hypothetical protein
LRFAWASSAFSICLLFLPGCATVSWPFSSKATAKAEPVQAKSSAAAPKSSGSAPATDALQEVMTELQQAGAMDPAARDELLADLKQTDPSRWPLVIQEYRAAAAYRQRIEARSAKNKQEYEALELAGARRAQRDETDKVNSCSTSTAADDLNKHHAERDEYGAAPPKMPAVTLSGGHLALAPEPPLLGGADIGVSKDRSRCDTAGEAIAIATEPPPLAVRLASSHDENVQRPPLLPKDDRGAGKAEPGKSVGKDAAPLAQADWHSHLAAAIRSMESTSAPGSKSENDIALQARLRMLYLLAGRRDDAMRPLPAAPRATQEYWSSQIYGLSTWMDSERTPDPARRAAETKRILGEALNQLGETAPLAVRNLTFCTEVHYFGSFDAVKAAEFAAGQKVLVYAEVENFRTEPSPKGFHTAVKFNWQIFDARGNRVGDYVSATSEEHSLTPKHEFFLTKWFYLPTPMSSGHYTLQFTVEDVLGHKVGQSSLELTIK